MIWSCLREVCPVKFLGFVQICDQAQCGTIPLSNLMRTHPIIAFHLWRLTEVASDPVLHTVRTFMFLTGFPINSLCWSSHSAPHRDIALFRPTSSSEISSPSAISSATMTETSFPMSIPVLSVFWSLRVAALKLTAVGRAVDKKARIGSTCARKATTEVRNSGVGDAAKPSFRFKAKVNPANDAIAGAPLICELLL